MERKQTTKRPTPIELRYGQEQYEAGYSAGYRKFLYVMRRRKEAKERAIRERFNHYVDLLEDTFAANRKR